LKHLALDAAAELGWRLGATRPERCHAARLTVLTFHRVLPEAERARYPYPGLAVTPEQLDACVRYAIDRYDAGPMTRQLERFKSGEHAGKPLLAITFDDGQWDNLVHAVPVLERHGVRATFYVPVDAIERAELIWHDRLGYAVLALAAQPAALQQAFATYGLSLTGPAPQDAAQLAKTLPVRERQALVAELERRAAFACPEWGRLMTWAEVRSLHERGHEIGSHSLSHELMPQLDDARIELEVTASKARIEEAIGAEVTSFCYPNGDSDRRCESALERAKYHNAVTTRWGTNGPAEGRYGLKRCDVDASKHQSALGRPSYKRLALRISGLQPNL
jgi:peptidoglycan/xylan/chitin deacetylase (PgdA/CDA1 family)